MSDPPNDRDDKIVSLDQRRREDAARQKAEIAARAKQGANGSGQGQGRGINQPFGKPLPRRAANDGGGTPIASGIGMALSWLTWGSLIVSGGLMLWARFGSALPGS